MKDEYVTEQNGEYISLSKDSIRYDGDGNKAGKVAIMPKAQPTLKGIAKDMYRHKIRSVFYKDSPEGTLVFTLYHKGEEYQMKPE